MNGTRSGLELKMRFKSQKKEKNSEESRILSVVAQIRKQVAKLIN